MKIKLKRPYSKKWKKGYLVTNPERRKTVILFNSKKDRSSTSYARYLFSCKLGKFLGEKEHVDHKNDDKSVDKIDNLQILSPSENVKKSAKMNMVELNCIICKENFSEAKRKTFLQNGGTSTTCSIMCSKKASSLSCKNGKEFVKDLSKQSVIREYKILSSTYRGKIKS